MPFSALSQNAAFLEFIGNNIAGLRQPLVLQSLIYFHKLLLSFLLKKEHCLFHQAVKQVTCLLACWLHLGTI